MKSSKIQLLALILMSVSCVNKADSDGKGSATQSEIVLVSVASAHGAPTNPCQQLGPTWGVPYFASEAEAAAALSNIFVGPLSGSITEVAIYDKKSLSTEKRRSIMYRAQEMASVPQDDGSSVEMYGQYGILFEVQPGVIRSTDTLPSDGVPKVVCQKAI